MPTKYAHQNAALRWYTTKVRSPFWLLKSASKHAHARMLPRLSWSWTTLLPSDLHRKLITSITVVSLPFVPYFLTVPRCITDFLHTIRKAFGYLTRLNFPVREAFNTTHPLCVMVRRQSSDDGSASLFRQKERNSADSVERVTYTMANVLSITAKGLNSDEFCPLGYNVM
jgi:hypothetical protein